jgi:hypothetical protein
MELMNDCRGEDSVLVKSLIVESFWFVVDVTY